MSTTWTPRSPAMQALSNRALVASAVCTTGTEAAPADGASSAGLALAGTHMLTAVSAYVEAGSAFAAGYLRVYLQNPVTLRWARRPDLDMAVDAGGTAQAFDDIVPRSRLGRIAVVPDSLGVACNITLIGHFPEIAK